MRYGPVMPLHHPTLSRSWAWPVAGLVLISTTGCIVPRTPNQVLTDRAGRAVADLQRLQPKLAKAGTPDAAGLSDTLASVRESLATLPPDPPTPVVVEVGQAPQVPLAIRSPDDGCVRVTVQGELAAWRVRLRGGGGIIDDVGPAAVGLAVAMEHAYPIDWRSEWSWGGEAVITTQLRSNSQHIDLIGVRPIVRLSIGLNDTLALTIRPLLEIGQATIKLGSAPGGILDKAGLYAGFGGRVGLRWSTESTTLTGELGWRRTVFNGLAGGIDYRVDAFGPEIAAGWTWRY